jgi:hypothetical protein
MEGFLHMQINTPIRQNQTKKEWKNKNETYYLKLEQLLARKQGLFLFE